MINETPLISDTLETNQYLSDNLLSQYLATGFGAKKNYTISRDNELEEVAKRNKIYC